MKKITLQEAISETKFVGKYYEPNIALRNSAEQDVEDYNYNLLEFEEYYYFIECEDGSTPWLEGYNIDIQEIWTSMKIIKNVDILNFPYPVYKLNEEEHCKYLLELNHYQVIEPKED